MDPEGVGTVYRIDYFEDESAVPCRSGSIEFAIGEGQVIPQIEEAVRNLEVGNVVAVDNVPANFSNGLNVRLVSKTPPPIPYLTPEQHRQKGNNLVMQKDYGEALLEYRRGLKLLQKDHQKDLEISLRLNAALCLTKLGRWREVASLCDIVLSKDANRAKALFRRGVAYQNLGEFELAIYDLSRAFELEDDQAIARALEESVKFRDEKKKTSREEFRKTYQIDIQW
ncbi:hypothetical protein NDN08_001833 [Rhodosorus marinus]|uniref:peptidylprolyl isomerase n=1 Tax=Rhodosorus marinus TaxID=101924 RepID=A0AAV8UUY9_9RHOD|nr:hypothetical protein NDN08_001833 [Rhodosorus marinus]